MLATQSQTATTSFQEPVQSPVVGGTTTERQPNIATGWRRLGYLSLATTAFGCSIVGVVLPGIPTTPFLLLTSYCLLRSSRRLHERLLASRLFGDLISNWQQHRSLRRSTRTKAILLTLIVVLLSVCLSNFSTLLLIAMLSGTGIGLLVILSLPVIES